MIGEYQVKSGIAQDSKKRGGHWNCLGAWKDVVEIIRRGPYGGINHPPNQPSHHSAADLTATPLATN